MQVLKREKRKGRPEPEGREIIMVKTTWRMPKPLLKRLKLYGLNNDMTLTQVAMKAFNDLLAEEP